MRGTRRINPAVRMIVNVDDAGSNHERALVTQLRQRGVVFEREFNALPGRRFRWDFALPERRVLIEIQGGTYARTRTGHSTGAGLHRDYIKNNQAVINGWRVLYFDAVDIGTEHAADMIADVYERGVTCQ
jgi:very-short-patch-repair endonuclease